MAIDLSFDIRATEFNGLKRPKKDYEKTDEERRQDALGLEKLRATLTELETLINQLDNHYRMFTLGVEDRPPLERRRKFDRLFKEAERSPKYSVDMKFRFEQIQSRTVVYRDRWDRMVRDLETGKIQRVKGPKARPRAAYGV